MVLSDFFDSILKRKLRYFLFLVQMILIFIIIQYSFNLVNEYRLFNNKLEEVSSKKNPVYYAFQSPDSEAIPECSFEEYENFKTEINQTCGDTAFSFSSSDLHLKNTKIPTSLIAFSDHEENYYPVTYISEHFFDYYNIHASKGRLFSQGEYEAGTANFIPAILGSSYASSFQVGDILDKKYKIIGILAPNASYLDRQLNSNIVKLDNQIILPMVINAKTWGGCYVNQLVFSTNQKDAIQNIEKIIQKYGFQDYSIRNMNTQIHRLRNYFWTEFSFMCVIFITLFMLCIFSMISMLQHLIEEQKTEFGIYMLCGASKMDICIKISMPVLVILFLASIPSIAMCKSIYHYLFQILILLGIFVILTFFPLNYWLKQPISELKKERE